MTNQEMIINTKSGRKMYSRDDMLSYFYCPKEIPHYLKDFPYLLNTDINELWYKRPLPKFEDMPEGKHKPAYVANKYKERQRTVSNQSGDFIEPDSNVKYKSQNINYTLKLKNDKANRFNMLDESKTNTSTNNEAIESDWQTVESKGYKFSNFTKPYISNYQGQENHWKKWSKDRTVSGEKNKAAPLFNRSEKTNNFIVRKAETENKQDLTKLHSSQSFSIDHGQTEDFWQDDWDTEMQSHIATTPEESLDCFELPPSCIASTVAVEVQCPLTVPTNNSGPTELATDLSSDFDLWYYIDLASTEQGPYPSDSMANWLATGYFDYATPLRRQCDERFLLLAEYRALYGRIPFTAGATIAPILKSTVVEIDPILLTVGLDRSIMQKVLTNATSLSTKMSPFITGIPISPDSDVTAVNDAEKLALLEEKRQLAETKAEFERERKQFDDDQKQWKIRMEKEMEAKMESLFRQQALEMKKNLIDDAKSVNLCDHIPVKSKTSMDSNNVSDTVDASLWLDQENVDEMRCEDWHSTKDVKGNKKSKKSKNKVTKSSSDPVTTPTVEVKKVEPEKTSSVVKESGSLRIVPREMMDEMKQSTKVVECPKVESQLSWNIKPTLLNVEQSKVSKSLLEIQAEETEEAKMKQEVDKALNQMKVESNKVTTFKESLLKSVGPIKTPVMPLGKSIWDLAIGDNVVTVVPTVPEIEAPVVRTEPRDKKKRPTPKPSEDYEKKLLSDNNSDGLLNWCCGKLSKFDRDLDVFTVVELLKLVPSENVLELTLELLDDSVFSRNFARDFVKKRQELTMVGGDTSDDTQWQTVKKQSAAVPEKSNNGSGKSTAGGGGKSKAKKKMVAIDHTKFKSG